MLDRQGLIQGLQIRRDHLRHPKDSPYLWLSSNPEYFTHGTKAGRHIHIQNPERIKATGRVLITEGALKAFVAAQYLSPDQGGLVALAGVTNFRDNFGHQLKSAWPELHTASIAFDRDWQEKLEVKRQLHRLIKSLSAASFSAVTVLTWEQGKGIDDFLVAEVDERQKAVVA